MSWNNMKREVIAFVGRQGSGKSYQSKKLVEERNFLKLSFADPLREIAFNVIGMDFEEGMKQYAELKKTEIINGLNFRNILENLGASVRKFDKDFWARALVTQVSKCSDNIVIDDLRYPNEYIALKNFCATKGVAFKVYYCNYHSDVYDGDNQHESAGLSNYLAQLGYQDLQMVEYKDICGYIALTDKSCKSFEEVSAPVKMSIQQLSQNVLDSLRARK